MDKEKYTVPKSMFQHILDMKRGMRECLQNGGKSEDLKKTAEYYGFRLVKPF